MVFFFLFLIGTITVVYLIREINKGKFSVILMTGLVLRVALLIVSYYDIIPVPDAHTDADGFHEEAVFNQDGWNLHSTNYIHFLTLVYYLTDCSRFFAQFINVVLGVYSLVILRKIFVVLKIQDGVAKRLLMIASFMPFLNIYSVVLLRESWIYFFIVFSLYHFVCWYQYPQNKVIHQFLSLVGVLAAMWMHAGVIGVLVGYFLAFLTYNHKGNCFKISKNSYIALFVGILFLALLLVEMDVFLAKVLTSDFIESVEQRGEGAGGNSDYLTWLNLSNPILVIVFSPLKMFYLLFSPIIIDWRGFNDIAAFFMDSLIYLYASWIIIKDNVVNSKNKLLKRYLLISFLSFTFIFSLGTSNAGTAIRHRAKAFPIILVVWAISYPLRDKEKHLVIKKNNIIEK